jgi:hypothetical protein
VAPEVRPDWSNQRANRLEPTSRPPLPGRTLRLADPGLKPWAVLSDHFMVKIVNKQLS